MSVDACTYADVRVNFANVFEMSVGIFFIFSQLFLCHVLWLKFGHVILHVLTRIFVRKFL